MPSTQENYPIWIEVFEYPFGLDLGGWFKDDGDFYTDRTGFKWPKSAEGIHFKRIGENENDSDSI